MSAPLSGTAIRTDPMANWPYIPRCVRPYFVKRVCVFGPESTGKTTLACRLVREVSDPVRYLPEQGKAFFDRCRAELDACGRRYVVIRGDWDERFRIAAETIPRMSSIPTA